MISSRKDCRSGEKKCRPASEAEAWYCQGNHAEATRNELAETMQPAEGSSDGGINPSTLGNWLDPQHASRMPEERRAEILRLTDDNPAVVRFLATEAGLVVYDPREARGKGVTRMVSEFSDLLKALDDANADSIVTPDEALRVEREAAELHGAVDAKVLEIKRAAGLMEDAK